MAGTEWVDSISVSTVLVQYTTNDIITHIPNSERSSTSSSSLWVNVLAYNELKVVIPIVSRPFLTTFGYLFKVRTKENKHPSSRHWRYFSYIGHSLQSHRQYVSYFESQNCFLLWMRCCKQM